MGVETKLLMKADALSLEIPYFQPTSKELIANPKALLSQLYTKRAKRSGLSILKGISFELYAGDKIGILGSNGSGKSSLLRLLARVYHPSSGRLHTNGTATGLFTITLGMSQEGTGLENIYLRGLQMGLTLESIREIAPEVILFAELGDAINRPINTYSTGMLLRLAFAISTMIEPDILLLDEWIGSGDSRFRLKANTRMNELVGTSRGLILASHNNGLLSNVCNKGIILERGEIVFKGAISDAIDYYEK